MNRKDSRIAKATAERTAELLAQTVYDIGAEGPPVRVSAPRAVRLLARGFLHELRHGMAPRGV